MIWKTLGQATLVRRAHIECTCVSLNSLTNPAFIPPFYVSKPEAQGNKATCSGSYTRIWTQAKTHTLTTVLFLSSNSHPSPAPSPSDDPFSLCPLCTLPPTPGPEVGAWGLGAATHTLELQVPEDDRQQVAAQGHCED